MNAKQKIDNYFEQNPRLPNTPANRIKVRNWLVSKGEIIDYDRSQEEFIESIADNSDQVSEYFREIFLADTPEKRDEWLNHVQSLINEAGGQADAA